MSSQNPFLLASHTPEPSPTLLPLLRSAPTIASQQDSHGYSLLHAAASYNHIALLRTLVSEFHVDVNLLDEDHETCLFVVESVEAARCLVEELDINIHVKNDDGQTAREKIETEDEWPDVAQYLRGWELTTNAVGATEASATSAGLSHPPPLPPNVTLEINTADEASVNGADLPEPDQEFKRRIEELAARDDFHTEEGQRELRELIKDAVRGVGGEEREVRRRIN